MVSPNPGGSVYLKRVITHTAAKPEWRDTICGLHLNWIRVNICMAYYRSSSLFHDGVLLHSLLVEWCNIHWKYPVTSYNSKTHLDQCVGGNTSYTFLTSSPETKYGGSVESGDEVYTPQNTKVPTQEPQMGAWEIAQTGRIVLFHRTHVRNWEGLFMFIINHELGG